MQGTLRSTKGKSNDIRAVFLPAGNSSFWKRHHNSETETLMKDTHQENHPGQRQICNRQSKDSLNSTQRCVKIQA